MYSEWSIHQSTTMHNRISMPGRPLTGSSNFNGAKIQSDFAKFSKRSDTIIANRLEDETQKSLR